MLHKHLCKYTDWRSFALKAAVAEDWRVYSRVFQKWHFVNEKNCNTSTHPSGVYINQIQKNFFPKTSLEGQTTWSKMEDFYNVDFHSAYSRLGQVKAEWKSTF